MITCMHVYAVRYICANAYCTYNVKSARKIAEKLRIHDLGYGTIATLYNIRSGYSSGPGPVTAQLLVRLISALHAQ